MFIFNALILFCSFKQPLKNWGKKCNAILKTLSIIDSYFAFAHSSLVIKYLGFLNFSFFFPWQLLEEKSNLGEDLLVKVLSRWRLLVLPVREETKEERGRRSSECTVQKDLLYKPSTHMRLFAELNWKSLNITNISSGIMVQFSILKTCLSTTESAAI